MTPSGPEGGRWIGHTNHAEPVASAATTRGVVFRSLTRAIGVRDGERLRDAIGGSHPELARAISDAAPLAWLPTELLTTLLENRAAHLDRDRTQLSRDLARATVRATFRRFFPASAATLVPRARSRAIRSVWGRYQRLGVISSMPVQATETVIRIAGTLRNPELCSWTAGMLEQLVTLSGAKSRSSITKAARRAATTLLVPRHVAVIRTARSRSTVLARREGARAVHLETAHSPVALSAEDVVLAVMAAQRASRRRGLEVAEHRLVHLPDELARLIETALF